MTTSALQWPDYLIMVSFLVISIGIGIYHSVTGGKQRTTAEFIMADRRLKVIPMAISLLVSFKSAVGMLGLPAEAYCYGTQYFIFVGIVTYVIGTVVVSIFFVPLFHPLKLVSINEYFELRFMSKAVRIFAALLGIVGGVVYIGANLFVASAALESGTGIPLTISVPVMVFVAVLYTSLGGLRAVIWTDVFQFVIMVGGITTILVKGTIAAGGLTKVFHLAEREGRLNWIDFNPDPRVRHTAWSLTVGFSTYWIYTYGVTQSSVQRCSAVKKLSMARLAVLLNIPAMMILVTASSLMGLVILAYYATIECDPIANKDISNINQLLPFFVFNIFSGSPGYSGLFLAFIYGALLSTVSTYLSGSAANIWEDILQWKLAKLTESRKALINRFLIVIIGILSYAVAFLAAAIPGQIMQVFNQLASSVSGPTLGIFLLGALSKHANWKGTLIGGFSGMAFCLWLVAGALTMSRKPQQLPPVSVEGCKAVNESFAFNYNSSIDFETTDNTIKSYWHENVTNRAPTTQLEKEEFHGLQNFYALSYQWFSVLSALVTIIVGFTASVILRDKELEAKVEARYLMRFKLRRSADEGDNRGETVSLKDKLEINKMLTITSDKDVDIDAGDIKENTKEKLVNV